MAKELSVLQQQAEAIKNEVNKGANTANRVGSMFSDMLDYNEEQSVTDKANTGISTFPVFSEVTAYTVDQVVNYNDKLYKFTADHPAGAWNSAHVAPTSLKEIQDEKLTELDSETILGQNNLRLYQGSIELSGNFRDKKPNSEIKNRCYAPFFKTQDVVLEISDGFEIRLIYGDSEYNSVGSIIYGAKEITTHYPYGLLVVAKNDNSNFTPNDVKVIIKNKIQDEKAQTIINETGIILWENENSSISVNDGKFITVSNRRRTKFNAINNVDKIIFPDTSKYYIVYYDNEKNWISSDGWKYDKEYSISENKPLNSEYFIILIDATQTIYKDIVLNTSYSNRIETLKKQALENTKDIQTLKSDVGVKSSLVSVEWENGGINSITGENNDLPDYWETRRRTKEYLPIEYNLIVPKVTANEVLMIMFYGEDNTFISTYVSSNKYANVYENVSINIDNIKPENALKYRLNIIYPKIEPNNLELYQNASGIFKEIDDIKEKLSKVYNFENLLIVDEKGHGDYTTIEDALNNANDTDENHVVILVMPGTYYPAPKKGNSDVPYAESNRNISILGVDKNSCILKGNVGYYYYQINVDYSLLRLNGNVTIENLTLDNRSELYEQTATENGWDLSSPHCRAYCVHVDGERQKNSIIEIRNCHLYNDHFTCIGFGTRPDSTLRIVDCDCTSDVSEEKNEQSGFNSYATLYGHLNTNSTQPNQNIEIVRCQIVNTNHEIGINLMDAGGDGASGNVKLIQNACLTSNMLNAFKKVDKFVLDKINSGNNVQSMNWQYE